MKETEKKIIQLLTEAPELVTLDCSFTHVLQVPNTQPYHRMDWGYMEVVAPHRQDHARSSPLALLLRN